MPLVVVVVRIKQPIHRTWMVDLVVGLKTHQRLVLAHLDKVTMVVLLGQETTLVVVVVVLAVLVMLVQLLTQLHLAVMVGLALY
jgi:hypothetical protein